MRHVFGTRRAREANEKEQAQLQEALSREAIDAEEACWLIAQMDKTDGFSEGERQLLAFIKENSPSIDPALAPLLEKAGL